MPFYPLVKSVTAKENMMLEVEFNNSVVKTYDCNQLLKHNEEMYKPLLDVELFNKVSVDCGGSAIAWNSEIDIPECELWRNGVVIKTVDVQSRVKKLISDVDFENDELLNKIYEVISHEAYIFEEEVKEVKEYKVPETCKEDITNVILEGAKGELTEVSYNTWIKHSNYYRIGDKFLVIAENSFTMDILERRYGRLIESILEINYGVSSPIEYIIKGDRTKEKILEIERMLQQIRNIK